MRKTLVIPPRTTRGWCPTPVIWGFIIINREIRILMNQPSISMDLENWLVSTPSRKLTPNKSRLVCLEKVTPNKNMAIFGIYHHGNPQPSIFRDVTRSSRGLKPSFFMGFGVPGYVKFRTLQPETPKKYKPHTLLAFFLSGSFWGGGL